MTAAALPPLHWRPEDLPAWARWQRSHWPAARRAADAVRSARSRALGTPPAAPALLLPEGDVHTLVALESAGPAQRAALEAPVRALAEGRSGHDADARRHALAGVGWAVPAVDAERLCTELPAGPSLRTLRPDADPRERLDGLRRVLVAGDYLPSGRAAVRWARERGAHVAVVQHGLLALAAPPVPRDVTLYAFTERDADWWTQGRADVRRVATGSALLAAAAASAPVDGRGPGVFLGQLHGAELPRREFAAAAELYLRETGAVYRPHPAEQDRLSRARHARWQRAGVAVDRDGGPLAVTSGPVAAVFSTGILEAAQAGRPAWAVHPDPPRWLVEFWERYGITRWCPGTDPEPTPALPLPAPDPAAAVARDLWKDQA